MNAQPIIKHFSNYYNYNMFTPVFIGIGISYAIEKKKYSHLPIALFFPGIYIGYQSYKNRHNFIYEKKNTSNQIIQ